MRWDAESGKALPPLATDGLNTVGIAISRHGRTVTTGSRDGVIRIWDVASGELAAPPVKLSAGANDALALSPDGRRVVTASPDGALHVWDADTGQAVLGPLLGHFTRVGALAYSPDGLRIVSAGSSSVQRENEQQRLDYTLRLWDATSGRAIGRPISDQGSAVVDVAFSQDGKHIALTASNGQLQVLDIFEGWSDALCAKLARTPTTKEWRDWVSPDIAYAVPCPHLEQPRLH